MTTRTPIGDGRFCYSGPTCKLHGAAQVKEARNAMMLASYKVASSTTLDEIKAAKDELAEATLAYDATNEGQASLKALIPEFDAIDGLILNKRLAAGQAYAKEFESKNKKSPDNPKKLPPSEAKPEAELVDLVLSDKHTYDVPTYEVVGDDMYAPTVGSKFTKWRSVTEIAKDIRSELKIAEEKGYLPKGLKYTVKGDKYSGGQSIQIQVQNLKEDSIYTKDVQDRDVRTEQAKELDRRISGIAGAYNSSVSRGDIDYFSSIYYSRVELEDNHSRKYRLKEAVQAKAKRDAKPLRENFKASYLADKTKALDTVKWTHADSTASVGRLGDTQLFVYKGTYAGTTRVRAYDLSDVEFKDEASPEDYILKNATRSTYLERKNFLKTRRPRRTR